MDDVAAEILLAGGNENLRAGDSEGAVSVRHGPVRKQAKVGSGAGLPQRHGASPLPGDHLRLERCLPFRYIMMAVGICRHAGETVTQSKGKVGRGQQSGSASGREWGRK